MKIKYLFLCFLLSIAFAGCEKEYEPEMPPTVIDNETPGKFNPRNCIVANQYRCNQLFRNTTFTEGDAVTFEFDSKKRVTKSTNGFTWEYPSESTVVMNWGTSRDVFYIGENGFANKCVSYENGSKSVYRFGYDKDGYLVGVIDDSGDQIIMEYEQGNLIRAIYINNCGETDEQCEYTYSNVSNVNFGYMPYYGFHSQNSLGLSLGEPFLFEIVYPQMQYAYLAGLIGKPVKMLPDMAVQTNNYGTKTKFYFHNQYVKDPSFIALLGFVLHVYGWSTDESPLTGGNRIESVSYTEVTIH